MSLRESAARRRKENAAAERREARRPAIRPVISGDPEIDLAARRVTGAAYPHQRRSALCSPLFLSKRDRYGATRAPLQAGGAALALRFLPLSRLPESGTRGKCRD